MSVGLVGRKCGMSRVFSEDGKSIPVTVIAIEHNRVAQIKSPDTDGYAALQVTAGFRKPSRINKALGGHYGKAGSEPGKGLWEFRTEEGDEAYELGASVSIERFTVGQRVDISGISKGKGFAGVVKRWNFKMQDATHGNSLSHRAPGSIGQNQTPGRVFKGKKMAGHMGARRVTTQNLEVVRVDTERSVLLIKGAVPGAPGGNVVIRPATKG